ncbi:S-phase kinase-associated protein 2-like [Galleria mellonella]|uniref:S-phase kinase-associated protein 2-like n=1 Tax=Galleria mellonella TaxID=7137 RepID=A0ABM3M9V9_GALME|nr:S-phase kinase-associated protein 2-like [Galleria mellonella]
MGDKSTEDDRPVLGTSDELDSPRKRMRLDNSARKGWSLTDRKADHEVLQEMGVSLLDPDDCEASDVASFDNLHQHKAQKRKRDIENVNPNVNSMSPRKHSPKSPRVKVKVCSPSPGPSRIRSPRSLEKVKLVQHTDLETSLIDEFLAEEETPLAQSVTAKYGDIPHSVGFGAGSATGGKKTARLTPLGLEEELIMTRRTKCEPLGADSFDVLSDEMILSVFKWLPKRTLANCMLVCKRWYRLACDETLWQRLDLGNKTLSKDALGRILARKPVVVRLASSEIGEWLTSTPTPSRIQYLDLSICTIDLDTLDSLMACCPALRKLSLENVQLRDTTCELIGKCKNLETLNLTMAQGITAEGLSYILNGCQNMLSLNLSWCGLTKAALAELLGPDEEEDPEDSSSEVCRVQPDKVLPRLQRLSLAGARVLSDDMIHRLTQRFPHLLELDLSDCAALSSKAVHYLHMLPRLHHLALSRCYLLPQALPKVVNMPALQFLDVWGMLPSKSLNALKEAMPSIQINQFMFSAIARPTVGQRRTSIWGLRTRD